MNTEENELDRMLAEHLSRELEPHVGRSARQFEAELSRERRRRLLWRIGGGLGAAAAAVALVLMLNGTFRQHVQPSLPPAATVDPNRQSDLVPVAHAIQWRTLDDGPVVLADDRPARQVRRQVLHRVQWYDAQHDTTIELTVPRQQVLFIGTQTH